MEVTFEFRNGIPRLSLGMTTRRLLPAVSDEMVPGLETLSGFFGTTSALAEAILNYRGCDRVRPGQKQDRLPGA